MTTVVPSIHRIEAKVMPVNAYIVELSNGVVVVDSLISMSDSKTLREKIESLNKPLLAVIITHSHPDHYAGLKQIVVNSNAPIIATEGVDAVIRRDDAVKNQIVGPMLGDE
ncbi:MBL fold metallo-hydrolase [Candidatus Roizmanbacteria bacterium]|nr:MBL fold metallo-hydrolase [Candidatus Roizmanbacteria bacterium]